MSHLLPIILASQSPRRVEILRYFSIPFEIIPHTFDERKVAFTGDPFLYVSELAKNKAESISPAYPNRLVLAADTIVSIDDRVLNKPENYEDAKKMLQRLSGRQHTVITAICLANDKTSETQIATTNVLLNPLTEEQISLYLSTNFWNDKAGGYAIQGIGALLVQSVEGCYYNVIGLPIGLLAPMLQRYGICLWNFLK
jgi:septum formation protein